MIANQLPSPLLTEEHNGAHSTTAPAAAVGAAPRRRTRRGLLRWMGAAVGVGLLLGALAAGATAPLRQTPRVVVTPVQSPGSGGLASAALARGESAASPEGAARATEGGANAAGRTRRQASAARTQGVISALEGDTITVNGPDGPVRVRLSDATTVQQLTAAGRDALVPGEQVVVLGDRGPDGVVEATSVQVVPQGDDAARPDRASPAAGPTPPAGDAAASRSSQE
ncbi:MAG: hypothetical protein IRZ14_14280 [Chloroflexi bacterium]|nr:hypothetical protein [Chloroflexota bacterium]